MGSSQVTQTPALSASHIWYDWIEKDEIFSKKVTVQELPIHYIVINEALQVTNTFVLKKTTLAFNHSMKCAMVK